MPHLEGQSTKGRNNESNRHSKRESKKLFGSDKLPAEDAEFFNNYANFAFDEIWLHSNVAEKERLMIILIALIATQGVKEFKTMLRVALNAQVSPTSIKEIIYQATPYVGISKVADFIHASNEIFKEYNIALPLPKQSSATRDNCKKKG